MIVRRFRVISALVLREMTTRYGRSAGGYIWAILDPLAFIVIFSIIFSQITKDPAVGRSFPLFFATGVIAFSIYRDISDACGGAFTFNKPLFTYPHITIVDAVLARAALQFLTQFLVAVIVFTGIFIIEDARPNIDLGPVMAAILIAAFIGLSVGMMNCLLFVFVPTWQRLWAVISRPLFLISGVFFMPEMLPPAIRELVLLNPLVHVVGLMRRGFYPTYEADYINWWLMLGAPALILVAALVSLRRFQGRLLEQ